MHEVPIGIETLQRHSTRANWLLIGLTVAGFVFSSFGDLERETLQPWILHGFDPRGMLGHLFLHADGEHLIGNLIFLLIFGNAICQTTGGLIYLPLYFACGAGAAVIHLLVDGSPAVGASGAISGLCGITLALFPLNRMDFGSFSWIEKTGMEIRVWFFCTLSALRDLLGAFSGTGGVAYWAHLGGLLSGVCLGLVCLRRGWIQLSCYDNKSLYELIIGRELERRDDRPAADIDKNGELHGRN